MANNYHTVTQPSTGASVGDSMTTIVINLDSRVTSLEAATARIQELELMVDKLVSKVLPEYKV